MSWSAAGIVKTPVPQSISRSHWPKVTETPFPNRKLSSRVQPESPNIAFQTVAISTECIIIFSLSNLMCVSESYTVCILSIPEWPGWRQVWQVVEGGDEISETYSTLYVRRPLRGLAEGSANLNSKLVNWDLQNDPILLILSVLVMLIIMVAIFSPISCAVWQKYYITNFTVWHIMASIYNPNSGNVGRFFKFE